MTETMITWIVIVSLVVVVLLLRGIGKFCKSYRSSKHRVHIIEFGSDNDIFFCPGDKNDDDDPEEL